MLARSVWISDKRDALVSVCDATRRVCKSRIARAIADMQLSKADGSSQRFYSMAAQIRLERDWYYEILEHTQKGDLDITEWLLWFLACLTSALKATDQILARVLAKATFWEQHRTTLLNERQRLLINKLFDGFEGKLNT